MNKYPEIVEQLIDILKTLPGVGRRTAERMAFSMLKWPPEKLNTLGELLKSVPLKISPCPECGNLSSDGKLCNVCDSPLRDKTLICVVEEASQIQNIEQGAFFKGVYHVLGGKLSPLEGRNTESLKIESLLRRVEESGVHEIILALSSDVEGQATSIYIANLFKDKGLRISRLAQGLPAGSDISYADAATIAAALNGRTAL